MKENEKMENRNQIKNEDAFVTLNIGGEEKLKVLCYSEYLKNSELVTEKINVLSNECNEKLKLLNTENSKPYNSLVRDLANELNKNVKMIIGEKDILRLVYNTSINGVIEIDFGHVNYIEYVWNNIVSEEYMRDLNNFLKTYCTKPDEALYYITASVVGWYERMIKVISENDDYIVGGINISQKYFPIPYEQSIEVNLSEEDEFGVSFSLNTIKGNTYRHSMRYKCVLQ